MKQLIRKLCLICLAMALLSACSTVDLVNYGDKTNGTKTMTIGASMPATRLSEAGDNTYGLVTQWDSSDELDIYDNYLNQDGTANSMKSLTFSNNISSGSSPSTTFTYTANKYGYFFNPQTSLCAFNETANTTNAYNSGTNDFTVTLSNLASQDGTASNLKNYDVMFGTAAVDADAAASNLSMNHLLSVIRFDLTNTDFTSGSTLSSVTFTPLTSSNTTVSSTTSILPASSTLTVSPTGTVTGSTSTPNSGTWTVNNVAVNSSNTASVYLIGYFGAVDGYLEISTTVNDVAYVRDVHLSTTLTSGTILEYAIDMHKALDRSPDADPIGGPLKYYFWDAKTDGPNSTYNTATVATNSCANSPTCAQTEMYVAAGMYYDKGITATCKSSLYDEGVWIKKRSKILGFDGGYAAKVNLGPWYNSIDNPAVISYITSSSFDTSNYFFIPNNGYYETNPSNPGFVAQTYHANYWIGESSGNNGVGYCLFVQEWDSSTHKYAVQISTYGNAELFSIW